MNIKKKTQSRSLHHVKPTSLKSPSPTETVFITFLLFNSFYTLQTAYSIKLEHYLKGPDIMLIIVRIKNGKTK
jgi:hypothetical protein